MFAHSTSCQWAATLVWLLYSCVYALRDFPFPCFVVVVVGSGDTRVCVCVCVCVRVTLWRKTLYTPVACRNAPPLHPSCPLRSFHNTDYRKSVNVKSKIMASTKPLQHQCTGILLILFNPVRVFRRYWTPNKSTDSGSEFSWTKYSSAVCLAMF